MKIYIGLNDIKPDGMGSAAINLITALKQQGLNVQPVHPWKDIALEEFYRFNPIFLSDSKETVMPDVCLKAMVDVLNNDPACKVFTHFGSPNWGAVVPYLRPDIKVIVSCHSTTPSALKLALANRQRTDMYIGVGQKVVKMLRKELPTNQHDKVRLIPNAIDITPIRVKTTTSPSQPIKILFLGRIEDVSKGCDKIPPIARELKRQGVSFQWDLIGYFHMGFEPRYKKLVEKCQVDDVLRLKGVYTPAQIHTSLADYDIMVMPSNYEGLSISLLECMAAQLPCIASDIASIASVIDISKPEGILVHKNDIHGFAHAIRTLTENPDLRRTMGEHARTRILSAFTLEQHGISYSQAIHDVLLQKTKYEAKPVPDHYTTPSSLKPHLLARLLPTWFKRILKKYV